MNNREKLKVSSSASKYIPEQNTLCKNKRIKKCKSLLFSSNCDSDSSYANWNKTDRFFWVGGEERQYQEIRKTTVTVLFFSVLFSKHKRFSRSDIDTSYLFHAKDKNGQIPDLPFPPPTFLCRIYCVIFTLSLLPHCHRLNQLSLPWQVWFN